METPAPASQENPGYCFDQPTVRTNATAGEKTPAAGQPAAGVFTESRRRGSHPHGTRYELGAFLESRHTGRDSGEQRDKDSNPVKRLWRPRALPGASLCVPGE